MNSQLELTNNLVNLAITDTSRAGPSAEDWGSEVEVGRANGATGRRRERRTSRPGEGGNAAARTREATKAIESAQLLSIDK